MFFVSKFSYIRYNLFYEGAQTSTDLQNQTWPQDSDQRQKLWGCPEDMEKTMDVSWRPGFWFKLTKSLNSEEEEEEVVVLSLYQADVESLG